MSYTAPVLPIAVGHGLSTYGPECCIVPRGASTQAAWPTSNLAIYVPIRVAVPVTVLKLASVNGGTVSGNFDLGIYDAAGTRLVSTGSTAQSGTNSAQIIDVTDTTLQRGLYYLAMSMDNTTGSTFRASSAAAPILLSAGLLSEALGSVTLPATATWTADQTLAYAPGMFALLEGTAV